MRVNIGEIKTQVEEMNGILAKKEMLAYELLGDLDELIGDDELEGKAFDAMKNYLRDFHKPIVQGLIMAYDEIKNANSTLLSDLYTQVSSDENHQIDADNLAILIQQQKVVLRDLEEKALELSVTMPAAANTTNQYVQQQRTNLASLESEIQKLENFNNTHLTHYSQAEHYLENVATGLNRIKGRSFDPVTKIIKYDTKNLDWSKALNISWNLKKTKKTKVNYKELNAVFWNQTDDYFCAGWEKNTEKLEEALQVIKSEILATGKLDIMDLVNQLGYGDSNHRLKALIELGQLGKFSIEDHLAETTFPDAKDENDWKVKALEYLKDSGEQIVKGNYTDNVTLLGTAGQVILGLVGVDLPLDIRDLVYDVTHFKWNWKCVGMLALDLVALVPIIGVFKYSDEVATLVKGWGKHLDEAVDAVTGSVKKVPDMISDAAKKMKKWFKFGDEAEDVADGVKGSAKTVTIKNPVLDNIRTGSALKADSLHAFNDIIDNYVGDATKFTFIGGDGVQRSLYQIEGDLNGKKGIYEWIVDLDSAKGVTHRRFIEGVGITGKPNARP